MKTNLGTTKWNIQKSPNHYLPLTINIPIITETKNITIFKSQFPTIHFKKPYAYQAIISFSEPYIDRNLENGTNYDVKLSLTNEIGNKLFSQNSKKDELKLKLLNNIIEEPLFLRKKLFKVVSRNGFNFFEFKINFRYNVTSFLMHVPMFRLKIEIISSVKETEYFNFKKSSNVGKIRNKGKKKINICCDGKKIIDGENGVNDGEVIAFLLSPSFVIKSKKNKLEDNNLCSCKNEDDIKKLNVGLFDDSLCLDYVEGCNKINENVNYINYLNLKNIL